MIEEAKEKFWNIWNDTIDEEKLSWVEDNLPYYLKINRIIQREDMLHIVQCLDSMVASLCDKYPGGDFVEAVLSNDLIRVLETADSVNEIVLRTYMLFIYNKIPYALRRF